MSTPPEDLMRMALDGDFRARKALVDGGLRDVPMIVVTPEGEIAEQCTTDALHAYCEYFLSLYAYKGSAVPQTPLQAWGAEVERDARMSTRERREKGLGKSTERLLDSVIGEFRPHSGSSGAEPNGGDWGGLATAKKAEGSK